MDTHHFTNSSNVKSATYDSDTKELTVEWLHGRRYPPIRGVSASEWGEFKNASSPGSYFNSVLRGR